jgi:hypothetical protein
MTPMLAAAALAALPADSTELAVAEIEADVVIERCQESCFETREELGRAFLTRAAAAAVLRGEIDAAAAANGRFLAPAIAEQWAAVLPAADEREPDTWVVSWAKEDPAELALPDDLGVGACIVGGPYSGRVKVRGGTAYDYGFGGSGEPLARYTTEGLVIAGRKHVVGHVDGASFEIRPLLLPLVGSDLGDGRARVGIPPFRATYRYEGSCSTAQVAVGVLGLRILEARAADLAPQYDRHP